MSLISASNTTPASVPAFASTSATALKWSKKITGKSNTKKKRKFCSAVDFDSNSQVQTTA